MNVFLVYSLRGLSTSDTVNSKSTVIIIETPARVMDKILKSGFTLQCIEV